MNGTAKMRGMGDFELPEEVTTFPHFGTQVIHEGQDPDMWRSRSVVPQISLATTFKQSAPGVLSEDGFEYTRGGNPTRKCLEECIAKIDGGNHSFVFSSGLAGTTALTQLLRAGDHIVCSDDVYGGTNRFFSRIASNFNIEISLVDAREPENVRQAMRPNTKMVWMETPSNPLMKIIDIQAVGEVAHSQENVIYVIDNTFASSFFQRPLDLGADVVFHSCTKYMNGHSDVLMGAVTMKDAALAERVKFIQFAAGAVPSPFDCFLANRGAKTLHLRMERHFKNGIKVASFLENHADVLKVIHPGLKSHPQHELAMKQMKGFSGMIAFYIRGGLEQASKFLSALKVFTLAESLGGFESLAEHPAIMTHASVPKDQREVLGIGDNLIRLSVGCEDAEDLINDCAQALKIACA